MDPPQQQSSCPNTELTHQLQQKLICVSRELENTRAAAKAEEKLQEARLWRLQELLNITQKERDQAREECFKLQEHLLYQSNFSADSPCSFTHPSSPPLPPSASPSSPHSPSASLFPSPLSSPFLPPQLQQPWGLPDFEEAHPASTGGFCSATAPAPMELHQALQSFSQSTEVQDLQAIFSSLPTENLLEDNAQFGLEFLDGTLLTEPGFGGLEQEAKQEQMQASQNVSVRTLSRQSSSNSSSAFMQKTRMQGLLESVDGSIPESHQELASRSPPLHQASALTQVTAASSTIGSNTAPQDAVTMSCTFGSDASAQDAVLSSMACSNATPHDAVLSAAFGTDAASQNPILLSTFDSDSSAQSALFPSEFATFDSDLPPQNAVLSTTFGSNASPIVTAASPAYDIYTPSQAAIACAIESKAAAETMGTVSSSVLPRPVIATSAEVMSSKALPDKIAQVELTPYMGTLATMPVPLMPMAVMSTVRSTPVVAGNVASALRASNRAVPLFKKVHLPEPPEADPRVMLSSLPEKGKLLQAVMQAGPLLQTLLLAGPLPQWRYPPPAVNTGDIPKVPMSSSPLVFPLAPHFPAVMVANHAAHVPVACYMASNVSTTTPSSSPSPSYSTRKASGDPCSRSRKLRKLSPAVLHTSQVPGDSRLVPGFLSSTIC